MRCLLSASASMPGGAAAASSATGLSGACHASHAAHDACCSLGPSTTELRAFGHPQPSMATVGLAGKVGRRREVRLETNVSHITEKHKVDHR